MLRISQFVHHISTNDQNVFDIGIGGDNACCLGQASWERGASTADIPGASIHTAEFILHDHRSRVRNVVGAVSA